MGDCESEIPSVLTMLEKTLFRTFAKELSFVRISSFPTKMIFSFSTDLLEKKGVTVLQNVLLSATFLGYKFP